MSWPGFADDLRLGHAAMACHISVSHFSRIFAKEHGTSFRRYLLGYRLERACEFLMMVGIPRPSPPGLTIAPTSTASFGVVSG